ncbi:P-loop NTPase family protein [Aliarcobacter butzleri]|uniref:hypothetical protein n=1 Tax=Aliarcobacter butzleri TaxID=28197 RepID=UPI0015870136|nr:hypothetical protein [Aliarcobacter butzleri]MCT7611750.1 hypothetical protein [Aliarcobacter butzleri]MCT7640255.1 hypothetical protein [Aliarcobacter butzleri]NUW28081.1 hypothetical protein [Aliarcobacter butzleri]
MKKTVLIINSKGSVGKTPTSFNLAYDLGMNIITNDKSVLIACYKDKTILTNQFELIENSVYDCGGFSAPGILNIVQQVNIVIVPVFNDPSSLIQTRDTLKQILPIAKKVIIVTTKTENKDADTIKNNLDKKYPGLEYFNLPLTKAFNHTLETGKSIKYLVETDKVYENWFGNFVQNNYIPFLNAVKKELEL